jgi:hypothetical protein
MDKEENALLVNKAEDFGTTAKKVNESSRLRRNHSKEALRLIDLSLNAGIKISRETQSISRATIRHRNQNEFIMNSFNIMLSNLNRQIRCLDELKSLPENSEVQSIADEIGDLKDSLEKGISLIKKVIDINNQVILLDKLVLELKLNQKKQISRLLGLARSVLKDAEIAVLGSGSNLQRGLKLAKNFKNAKRLIERKDKKSLLALLKEAKTGWNMAARVNKSSNSQFAFAEKVYLFTKQLHDESADIKSLVMEKHALFRQTEEPIAEISVLAGIEIQKYAGNVADLIKKITESDAQAPGFHKAINNLLALVNITFADISMLSEVNYDMSDSINQNASAEKQVVELSRLEMEYYDGIKSSVEAMTEATRYPVEGSGRNIQNGKILEETLKKIISNI